MHYQLHCKPVVGKSNCHRKEGKMRKKMMLVWSLTLVLFITDIQLSNKEILVTQGFLKFKFFTHMAKEKKYLV